MQPHNTPTPNTYEIIATSFDDAVTIRLMYDNNTTIHTLTFPDTEFLDYANAVALAATVVKQRINNK